MTAASDVSSAHGTGPGVGFWLLWLGGAKLVVTPVMMAYGMMLAFGSGWSEPSAGGVLGAFAILVVAGFIAGWLGIHVGRSFGLASYVWWPSALAANGVWFAFGFVVPGLLPPVPMHPILGYLLGSAALLFSALLGQAVAVGPSGAEE